MRSRGSTAKMADYKTRRESGKFTSKTIKILKIMKKMKTEIKKSIETK